MARISELEQRGDDTFEIAINQSEFDRLGSAIDPFELRMTILSNTGAEIGNFLLSDDPLDWVLDPDTNEYLLVVPVTGFGNHRTNWDGMVLSSTNATGLDTVEDALMVGPFNEAVDADGPLATSVSSATNIPVGTALTLIDQSNVVGSGSGATLRFDAPDIDTPIVSTEDDLGNTGTSPPVCFVDGTMIACETEERLVDDLEVGDRVRTQDHGLQTIRWVGKFQISAQALRDDISQRPIRIAAGALGAGLPRKDLRVSRHHRIVMNSALVEQLTGVFAVFMPAHRFVALPQVSSVSPKQGLTYYHILFDQHEIVYANGMPSESLFLGPQAMSFLDETALLEIEKTGAGAKEFELALPTLDNKSQKELIKRHAAIRLPVYRDDQHEALSAA